MVDSLADLDNGATEMWVTSHGNEWSCYFKDLGGSTVEACLDAPFHVPQPDGEPLDLTKSDDEMLRETESSCRADPGFMMMD
jgi:catechol 2,3-dioxygenase